MQSEMFAYTIKLLFFTECPAGSHQPKKGQTLCEKCPTGQFQEKEGQTDCVQCAPGKSSKTLGSTKCEGKFLTDILSIPFLLHGNCSKRV
jgi:hypothetical protein